MKKSIIEIVNDFAHDYRDTAMSEDTLAIMLLNFSEEINKLRD